MNNTKTGILNQTPEEREVNRLKGVQARIEKVAWAKENLRDDYLDKPLWSELASKVGMRLPPFYAPATEDKYVRRFIKKVGKTPQDYTKLLGFSYTEVGSLNPTMPAYAAVGLFLECADEEGWVCKTK